MAGLLRELKILYNTSLELADPRVENWPLMSSPLLIFVILIFYQYFFRSLGPKIMENRPPMNVKTAMIVYNTLQIVLSGWFVEESFRYVWLTGKYSLWNQKSSYSTDPQSLHIIFVTYMFFLSKVLDLMDTVFIVLRKKTNQQSFLHTYHHTAMVVVIWLGAKFMGGGNAVIFGTINAFVHTVMYSYYLLTLIRPEYKKSVWWKRHITELQIVQFIVTIFFGMFYMLTSEDIKTRTLAILIVPQDAFFLFMFWDFYKKTYLTKPKAISKES